MMMIQVWIYNHLNHQLLRFKLEITITMNHQLLRFKLEITITMNSIYYCMLQTHNREKSRRRFLYLFDERKIVEKQKQRECIQQEFSFFFSFPQSYFL